MINPDTLAELHETARKLHVQLAELFTATELKGVTEGREWALATHLRHATDGALEAVSELNYVQRYADLIADKAA